MTWNLEAAVRIGDTIHVHERVAAYACDRASRTVGSSRSTSRCSTSADEVCHDGQWVVMFRRDDDPVTAPRPSTSA